MEVYSKVHGKIQIKIFINNKVMINWTKTGLWLQSNFTRVEKVDFFGEFWKNTYVSAIWLKPWSFTNNNLPFLMVITFFWFSGFFPSKRGVRGVTPSCVVRGVSPTDAICKLIYLSILFTFYYRNSVDSLFKTIMWEGGAWPIASVGVTPRIFPIYKIARKQEEVEYSVLQCW